MSRTVHDADDIAAPYGLTRREALRGIGLAGLGAIVASCGNRASSSTVAPTSCVLTPRQIEGPYFLDTGLMRSDITEGKPGSSLELRLQLVDVDRACAPIEGATIELWHADALGVYSGFDPSQGNLVDAKGEHFLRGFQVSDSAGGARFLTIFPGWYPGRAPHLHLKASVDRESLVTTQLYFPDAWIDRVYARDPYAIRGAPQTRNRDDAFALSEGEDGLAKLLLAPAEDDGRLIASHLIGVTRAQG